MKIFTWILFVSLVATLAEPSPINPQLLKSLVGAKTTETIPFMSPNRRFTTPKVITFDITLQQGSQEEDSSPVKVEKSKSVLQSAKEKEAPTTNEKKSEEKRNI